MITFPAIQRHDLTLTMTVRGDVRRFTLQSLPSEFIDWQINDRFSMFESLKQGIKPVFLAPHLPTLLTINPNQIDFPLNAASKGIGLIPVDDMVEALTKQLRSIHTELTGVDFQKSLLKRIQAVNLLYANKKKINYYALGGLEIFETQSFFNIAQDPRVSLFFVSGSPTYKSYQINCIAEIIDSGQPFYEFVLSIRNLFEGAKFHFKQPKYPYAIKYHVVEVRDKSLQVRGS